jgi:RNA polymerase sigma-70 factor (ECF subfamily)
MTDPRQRLAELLEPHHREGRAFARRLCRSDAEGDDVFHDAVLRALDNIADLRDDAAFRPWFYRVVVTTHRNRYRRSFWRRLVPMSDASEPSVDPAAEALAGAQRVRAALAGLPAPQREALVMFELEGMSVAEIAEVQDAGLSAVKSRLTRARSRLRSIYIKRFGFQQAANREVADRALASRTES